MIHSLNVSVACAVTLYEAYRQKWLAGHYEKTKLGKRDYDLLSTQWNLQHEQTT